MRNSSRFAIGMATLALMALAQSNLSSQELVESTRPAEFAADLAPESITNSAPEAIEVRVASVPEPLHQEALRQASLREAATDAVQSREEPSIASLIPGGGGNWSHVLALSALSLAPAILLMTTCFVRIAVVLGLLRQALGMSQLPPTQVLTALSLFMTALVMTPVWTDIYQEAIIPYQEARAGGSAATIPWEETWSKGVGPLRKFMSRQIDRAGNDEDVWLFYNYLPESRVRPTPSTYDDIPLQALLPAFLLSELKVAFLIGFQICLPFLIVDLVVASVTTSMGMMMLPPGVVSLPLKLLLFVLLDGWRLVVGMLLESFAPYS